MANSGSNGALIHSNVASGVLAPNLNIASTTKLHDSLNIWQIKIYT